MKQSWKLRLIFFIVCIIIVMYLGFKRNVSILGSEQKYENYHLTINEVMVNNRNSIRDEEGDFQGWLEIYNKGNTPVNLQGFGLSNDPKQPFQWTFPDVVIEPKSFCIIWTSGKNKSVSDASMHTNFKLKNKDKIIILTGPNSKWHDILFLHPMGDNISYGRSPDGSINLYGFDEGTPGKANTSEILIEGPSSKRLEGPLFSHNGGFYTQPFYLTLKSNEPNTEIYYTLDGSVPTKKSNQYTQPILISPKTNAATVVRARTYKKGYPKSKIITHSYFVEKNTYDTYNIPVVSLVTDPKNLFDYEKGIYVAGKIFDQWKNDNPNKQANENTPANYNQRGKNWEREGSIELFHPDGSICLAQNIGIRTFGGYSRASNIKSLSLLARKEYDKKEYFSYDFFDGKSKNFLNNRVIDQFSRILLRTSASDSNHSLFRDALIQSLVQSHVSLDTQNCKPCILYINGEYYGIHNIREAYDKNYITSHYNIDKKDIVIIKNPTGSTEVEIEEGYTGDEIHYNQIIDYIKKHDLRKKEIFNFIKTQMDIDNFIEYNVLQIYCDNRDWPGNNVRIWRKRTPTYEPNAPYGHDGRWRWMVFDLDFGFGLYEGKEAVKNNSLKRATEPNGPIWPNPPWSTLLLRSLLENDNFKKQFINVFADRLNTIFQPAVVLEKIEAMEKLYYPNIKKHITRWNLHDNNVKNWKKEIEIMKKFAMERPEYIRQHIVEYFDLSGTSTLEIEMSQGGIVKINTIQIEHSDAPWEGIYFKDVPITIEAVPNPEFEFAGWEGISKSQDRILKVNLSNHSYLKAVFNKQ